MFNDERTLTQIMETSNAYKIKVLGSNVKNFDQLRWQSECETEVLIMTFAKFKQNPDLKSYLLSTGSKHIVETTKDQFWGGGRLLDDIDVLDTQMMSGKNVMGRCPEAVHETLKQSK